MLKNTTDNFPLLNPNEPTIENSSNDSPKDTNAPIDINEEVLRSIDETPTEKIQPPKNKDSKESANFRNTDSSPPHFTATSIILKSRKKKTSSQEKKIKS